MKKSISVTYVCLAVIIIASIACLSCGSYYQAPHTNTFPEQETTAVLNDMDFYLSYSNHNYKSVGQHYYPFVYAKAIFGTTYIRNNNSDVQLLYGVEKYPSPSNHFNYSESDYIGTSYSETTYLVLSQKYEIDNNVKIVTATNRFESVDYEHLGFDISSHKIHDNFVDVYVIY